MKNGSADPWDFWITLYIMSEINIITILLLLLEEKLSKILHSERSFDNFKVDLDKLLGLFGGNWRDKGGSIASTQNKKYKIIGISFLGYRWNFVFIISKLRYRIKEKN